MTDENAIEEIEAAPVSEPEPPSGPTRALLSSSDPSPEAIRARGIEVLREVVLQGMSLALLAQRAHWSVRGPMFGPLHALFGEVYGGVSGAVDRIAESCAVLGAGDVMGDVLTVNVASLPTVDGLRLCLLLTDAIDAFVGQLYLAFERCEEMRLVADANALQSTAEDVRKLGWMVRSHTLAG